MPVNKPLNVAQIGVGYWGPNLLRNLVANHRCRVKTVVDLSPERLEYVAGLYPGVTVTSDVNDVAMDSSIDAVVIATPVCEHCQMSLRFLEAGKHILVEKPMARSVGEVQDIKAAAEKNRLVAMVGHTFLYNGAVRYLKQLIDSGEIGDIRYMYSHRLNLGRIRSDVDALWNFAPHDVSIIQYLLNDLDPVSVDSHGMDFVQPGIQDVAFINILYPGKIMAHVHVSWLDPLKDRSLTVVGTKKMVVYNDVAENKISIFDKGIDRMAVLGEHMDYDNNPTLWKFTHRNGDVIMPGIALKEPLKVEIDHFFDCIQNGEPCLSGCDHALKVVRILSECSFNGNAGGIRRESP